MCSSGAVSVEGLALKERGQRCRRRPAPDEAAPLCPARHERRCNDGPPAAAALRATRPDPSRPRPDPEVTPRPPQPMPQADNLPAAISPRLFWTLTTAARHPLIQPIEENRFKLSAPQITRPQLIGLFSAVNNFAVSWTDCC